MPKNYENTIFVPAHFTQLTKSTEIDSWNNARKKMDEFRLKPHLFGNPDSSPLKPYPKKELEPDIKSLRDIIHLWWGDITKLDIHCIVNSANSALKFSGGVCGAIGRAAGDEIHNDILSLHPNGCKITKCVITKGYKLPAKYIIHAVPPTKMDLNLLSVTYKNILRYCKNNGIRNVCICCLGIGSHFLPTKKSTNIAIHTCIKWLLQQDELPKTIHSESNEVKKKDDKGNEEIKELDNIAKESETEKTEIVMKNYMYFDQIIFNCFTEETLEIYKTKLLKYLG